MCSEAWCLLLHMLFFKKWPVQLNCTQNFVKFPWDDSQSIVKQKKPNLAEIHRNKMARLTEMSVIRLLGYCVST